MYTNDLNIRYTLIYYVLKRFKTFRSQTALKRYVLREKIHLKAFDTFQPYISLVLPSIINYGIDGTYYPVLAWNNKYVVR